MADKSIYDVRTEQINQFIIDSGRDKDRLAIINLDDICRDILVMSGNFFKPTGFEELCDDYGVIAFSKDITDQALSDTIFAVKNPDALKKKTKYYPPYNIFRHMASAVIKSRHDPTFLFNKEASIESLQYANCMSLMCGISNTMFLEEKYDPYDEKAFNTRMEKIFSYIEKIREANDHKNLLFCTQYGIFLIEEQVDCLYRAQVIRFTKHGKYEIIAGGDIMQDFEEDGAIYMTHFEIDEEAKKYNNYLHNSGYGLCARLFPRSYACTAAFQSFIQNHYAEVKADDSVFTYSMTRLIKRLLYAFGEPISYYTIDLAVAPVIAAVIIATVGTYFRALEEICIHG